MYSLLITIISIALVVALIAATMFHGDIAFLKSKDATTATQIITQGQQLVAAAVLYNAEKGEWPQSEMELIEGGYLKSIPYITAESPKFELISSAYAGEPDMTWTIPFKGVPIFVVSGPVSVGVCREINKQTRGDDGILLKPSNQISAQCFGESLSNLTAIVSLDKGFIDSVATADMVNSTSLDILIATANESDWLVAPNEEVSAPPPENVVVDSLPTVSIYAQFGNGDYYLPWYGKNYQTDSVPYPAEYMYIRDANGGDIFMPKYSFGPTVSLDFAFAKGTPEPLPIPSFQTYTVTYTAEGVANGTLWAFESGGWDFSSNYAELASVTEASLIDYVNRNHPNAGLVTAWFAQIYTSGGYSYARVRGDTVNGTVVDVYGKLFQGNPPPVTYNMTYNEDYGPASFVVPYPGSNNDGNFNFRYTHATVAVSYTLNGEVWTASRKFPLIYPNGMW